MDVILTYPTPPRAPFPTQEFYRLNARETARRSLLCVSNASQVPCELPIRIGLFFDGTNNNLPRDRYGERIGTDGNPIASANEKPLLEQERSQSNVARLFEAYAKTDIEKGIFSYYLPGVGTPFNWVGEPTETSDGKAFAKEGEVRIMFALVQIVNSVYAGLTGKPKFSLEKAGDLAQDFEKFVEKPRENEQPNRSKLKNFFGTYMDDLVSVVQTRVKPRIPSSVLDVFGLSFIHKEIKYQELLDREAHNIRRPDHDYPETSIQIANNKTFGNDRAGIVDTAG